MKKRLSYYCLTAEIDEDLQKQAIWNNLFGSEGQEIFHMSRDTGNILQRLCLYGHFLPKKNVIYKHYLSIDWSIRDPKFLLLLLLLLLREPDLTLEISHD